MFYHKQMVNNLRYRMQTRTREVSMLRAVGLSVTMTKKMIMFENIILGMIVVFILISTGALIIYAVLSLRILKQWKSRRIVEGIGALD